MIAMEAMNHIKSDWCLCGLVCSYPQSDF